jgi:hydrophobe/amphiphile efflux-1 (HAE1) family protein
MNNEHQQSVEDDGLSTGEWNNGANHEAGDVNDLPSLSIRRPVLMLVINLLIALAGVAALLSVEVRELPDVDRPIVTVRASYPGASPETMDAEVASILEGAVARVSGVKNIRSSSEENSSRMRIEFQPGVDLNTAAADVREAISQVVRRLPERVEDVVVLKADDDSDPIMHIAILSDELLEADLTRLAEKAIVPELVAVTGVADVRLFGARDRLLRVAVDPLRLASYGISVTDITQVLRQAAFDVPAGSFRSADQELIVRANASTVTAEEVADIIIRDTLRVGDVAKVYFAPRDADNTIRLDGRQVVGLGVVRQARSNTIQISGDVRVAVDRLNARFDDLELRITQDNAEFIRHSVREVLTTLLLTIAIVVATLWLFMGSLRATLIPSVTIPVALVGTVAAIWLLGFSVNILTLLALVLATGLVVDDAIVVLENIQRRRSQGLGARAAAVLGTRQVFFAVVTTTLVLISVFVPIAFLPSTAGRLFREFGLVLAVAVGISSFVALSLVPVMVARLPAKTRQNAANAALAKLGNRLRHLYEQSLASVLRHPLITLTVAIVIGLAAASAFRGLEQELLPPEDRGLFTVNISGPDGVGLGYMERQTQHVEAVLQPLAAKGEVQSLLTMVGAFDPNRSRITVPLTDWEQRERSQQAIMQSLRQPLERIPGARVSVRSSNSLNLGGGGGGSGGIQVALLGNDYQDIFAAAKVFARAIEESSSHLSRPEIAYAPTQPQLSVQVDRRRAADLGVDLDNLSATLRAMIDGDEIIDLNVDDEAVPILLESTTGRINDPSDLVNLYVTGRNGALIPLSSLVTLREEGVAAELDRQAQRRAIDMSIDLAPGYPLQAAVDELQRIAEATLPPGVALLLLGEAATLQETSREVAITYGVALVVVFLLLCAQFEGFSSAVVITLIVPFGIAAAIFALFLSGTSVNIYSQIGLVMLIGLMAKNGILLVEFADQLRDRGCDVLTAIHTGASVRLRPVIMTMISTVLGGLPLILSDGAGAEARASIGWVVFGGLGLAAVFTLYLTPALYLLITRFSKARAAESQQLAEELEHARTFAQH